MLSHYFEIGREIIARYKAPCLLCAEAKPDQIGSGARGLATLTFDGPGQGESEYEIPIRGEYETAVKAVVDWIEQRGDLDAAVVGALAAERPDAGKAVTGRRPEGRGPHASGGDGAQPGDHDPAPCAFNFRHELSP